jgi:isopentenyl phosphate kinase
LDKVFTILSGDQLVARLAVALNAERIIIGVDVDGLCTADPHELNSAATLIKHAYPKELKKMHRWIEKARVTDVTGGMYGKIIELIPAIEHGVKAIIVNATKQGFVRRALCNEKVRGTIIEKEREE